MKLCLVGNLNDLDSSYIEYLSMPNVDILASTESSINSCLIKYSDDIKHYDECVVVYSSKYAKYVQDDFGNESVVTPDSLYSPVCFFHGEDCTISEAYMFRLFVELYFLCESHEVTVTVLDKTYKYTAQDFISQMITKLKPPRLIDTRGPYNLFDFHTSSNEYIECFSEKENLTIVLGDSWAAGDNKDVSDYWHAGLVDHTFGKQFADHYNSDLLVCASPGNSNQGAVLNFEMWLLFNRHKLSNYNSIRLIISQTTYTRDFTAKGNIGNWTTVHPFDEYILMQSDRKLISDSVKSIDTCIRICSNMGIDVIVLRSHGKELNCYIQHKSIVSPSEYGYESYDLFFKKFPGMLSSCGHPNKKGHLFLAQEIIKHTEK